MSVQIAIPAVTSGQPDILHARISYKDSGDGSFWLDNINLVTNANHQSINNVRAAAQWLAGKQFTGDVHIELVERRQEITGRSWELALTIGLASLLTGQLLNPTILSTGIVGAGGIVLAVGDLAEKVAASRRAGYRTLLISREQRWEPLGGGLQVITVEDIKQAWKIAATVQVNITPLH